ncbi:glycosyltransferase family 4 protein [Nesterenkonia flava]|uniref:Glycosyltransferase family 4 protein n=1 Tax=Nesterenkonia flava TaxID=469799 RepID=A0ABU1FR06_9MICC|nr:glycosyltransferase family 4 protein [Nesterenkonia flava]MDR5711053.1 glycosyltransferase family 4 protein [Nesterenkonia flava]
MSPSENTALSESTAASEHVVLPQAPAPVVGYVLKMYPRFSETFVVSEILAREAAGEKIVIFSLRPTTDTRFHAELARVQAPVIHIGRTSAASRFWQRLGEAAEQPTVAAGLARALPELLELDQDDAFQSVMVARAALEHGVTHLHAHFASVATTVARAAGMIAGLPYSFTAHAKDIFHESVDQEQLRRKLADAHHAITISGYNLEDLRRRFGTATSRLYLVHNGLNLERFPYEPERPSGNGVPRLLAVGRLVEKKGFLHIVDAVARLKAAGMSVRADILGDGPEAGPLRERIAALGVQDEVSLLGARTQAEVTEMLGSHDLFVAPFVVGADGNADGLPTVLLEAMARGIPCVAADVTAVGEVIRNGSPTAERTGWLVPTSDAEALTGAVREALGITSQRRRQITDAARNLVESLFDSRRQATHLRRLVSTPRADLPTLPDLTETEQSAAADQPAAVRASLPAGAPSAREDRLSDGPDRAVRTGPTQEVLV